MCVWILMKRKEYAVKTTLSVVVRNIINNSKHYADSFNEILSQMEGFPTAANLS